MIKLSLTLIFLTPLLNVCVYIMTILYLENDDHISNFFFKLFQSYDLQFHHISRLQSLEDYLMLNEKLHRKNLLIVNSLIDDKDMFSYTAYIKRKFQCEFPVIAYSNSNIIENSMRAKQTGINHFFVLPALPYDIIHAIHSILDESSKTQINNMSTTINELTHTENTSMTHRGISKIFKEYLDTYFLAHPNLKPSSGLYERIMNEIEPQIILSSLKYTNGNRLKAADILGINRNTLRKKMTHYKIDMIS